MEKLEKKILEKINNEIVLSKDDCPLRYAPEWASKNISSEVINMIREFDKWKQTEKKADLFPDGKYYVAGIGAFTVEKLFNEFITNYYK